LNKRVFEAMYFLDGLQLKNSVNAISIFCELFPNGNVEFKQYF